ncbi:MAG: hypothetical protein JJT78_16380 [Leptospira sp.]|nr:hypothetical protein [Leptospira sp.]
MDLSNIDFSKPFMIGFDEFFKLSCKDFFQKYDFKVESEYEIFNLPKRLDVLAIHSLASIPEDFTLLKYWKTHNLISYKSNSDKFQKQDVLSAILYLNGYINNNPESDYQNSSMSIFMNHGIPKYFKEFSEFIQNIEKGVFVFHFNFFQIYLIDLRKIYLSGQDRMFLASFSSDKKFYELLNLTISEQNEVDKVKPYMKMRVAAFEKDEQIRRQFMASSKLADIREFVKPVYFQGLEEGRLEGKLEDARLMKAKDYPMADIIEITGLSESQLEENGI